MDKPNVIENSEPKTTTLIAKIDQRAMPALDKIAEANQVNTAQLMVGLFTNIADSVDFLALSQDESSDKIEEKLARLVVERCPMVTTGGLQMAQRVWKRAAEIKAQEGVN